MCIHQRVVLSMYRYGSEKMDAHIASDELKSLKQLLYVLLHIYMYMYVYIFYMYV